MLDPNPLHGPPPAEVPLPNAPLVRVIAQLRFPLVIDVAKREFVGPFQAALRESYPVLRQEQTQGLVLGATGLSPAEPQTIWRFGDVEGKWRVSLAPDFLALETTAYRSRADFGARLATVVEALDRHVGPKLLDRVGVRYIDRLTGDALGELGRFVRPEVAGLTGAVVGEVAHSITETLFELPPHRMVARWGRLPPDGTVDPIAIEPVKEPSWILDLDAFRAEPVPFSVAVVNEEVKLLAERSYAFFRWCVTPHFLQHFGGKA